MEYTKDAVREAWLDAKSFVSSCEEKLRYCLSDTFLAEVYTSEPSPLPSAEHLVHISLPEGKPELAVLHHTPAVSNVNTTAVCATVAHHVTPRNETSPFEATLGRYIQSTNSDMATPSPLGPDQKGHTPVYDPDSVHGTVTKRHLDDLSATLNAQTQRVGDAMTDIIGQVKDKATLTEMETLVSAAGESAKKVTYFLTTGQPGCVNRTTSNTYKGTMDAFSVKTTRVENASQMACYSREDDLEAGHATGVTNQHMMVMCG